MDRISYASRDFGLTISLKKTNVLSQDVDTPSFITINNYQLEVVHKLTYLGSTITDNLSLDDELNKRIGKPATLLGRLATRVDQKVDLHSKIFSSIFIYSIVHVGWLAYHLWSLKKYSFWSTCMEYTRN